MAVGTSPQSSNYTSKTLILTSHAWFYLPCVMCTLRVLFPSRISIAVSSIREIYIPEYLRIFCLRLIFIRNLHREAIVWVPLCSRARTYLISIIYSLRQRIIYWNIFTVNCTNHMWRVFLKSSPVLINLMYWKKSLSWESDSSLTDPHIPR